MKEKKKSKEKLDPDLCVQSVSRFSPSFLVCCSAEKRDRNKCGSSSHGATPHKMMHFYFLFLEK